MAARSNERTTKDIVNTILDDYEKLTRQLFESLSATSLYRGPTKNDASSVDAAKFVEQLTEKDKELQAAIRVAKEQMECQKLIQAAKDNVSKKDQEILKLENSLKEAEQILSQALFQAKKKLSAIEQANKGSVSSEELIKYAHKISSSNAVEAPTTWMPGDPRRPYPLDVEMRSGILGSRVCDGTNAGESFPSGQENTLSSTVAMSTDSIANGQSTVPLSWQSHLHGLPSTAEQDLGNNVLGPSNGRQEQITTVEEVEFMSSSSSSSSSESP
ncbi:mediator of RNA polymerase II transcription subunit 4 isoform X2 [Exaiptasia diaphana]|uniref:Mediator of RNA polymerase II transcription subunit 4 n=1 Tax=Exaiptasia diaphana TaxID=2652724 RepID=A0A913WR82_EXADI|nr:mediator of RNA polymerase II transcription subunit 4 isoform X2 [Exaiptasia diaphana]